MSGIEIAGIVLGALPVIFEALDGYKNSVTRVGMGIRKRKYVDKLSRALREQNQTLEAIVQFVLQESGYEMLLSEQVDIAEFLQDQSAKDRVRDYLGDQYDRAFIDAVTECCGSVQRALSKVATYVPSLKVIPD